MNQVNLVFAGDAGKLSAASKKADKAVAAVGNSATEASDDFRQAAASSDDFATRAGKLGAAVDGASTAIGDAAGTMQALVDIQQAGKEKASRLARALNDAEQAQQDLNQAQADGRQATLDAGQAHIDAEQAALDVAVATREYNKAVKEHGKNSTEARQAQLDLKQAQQDGKQATEDLNQANLDAAQAITDAGSAQLDLNDAQREANPPELQSWADQLNLIAPLLSGVVGVVALVTAAQWAWNAAQLASPTTWIIIGIVALIAVIVLIATKTTWFQSIWKAMTKAIGAAIDWVKKGFQLWWKVVSTVYGKIWSVLKVLPGRVKSAFSGLFNIITAPFRTAFNFVARAWNNTIGKLRWTVPGWVPGVGGNSIAAPQLPTFHQGGIVPGAPGQEVPILAMAGERVTPAGRSAGGSMLQVDTRGGGTSLERLMAEWFHQAVRNGHIKLTVRGGQVAVGRG